MTRPSPPSEVWANACYSILDDFKVCSCSRDWRQRASQRQVRRSTKGRMWRWGGAEIIPPIVMLAGSELLLLVSSKHWYHSHCNLAVLQEPKDKGKQETPKQAVKAGLLANPLVLPCSIYCRDEYSTSVWANACYSIFNVFRGLLCSRDWKQRASQRQVQRRTKGRMSRWAAEIFPPIAMLVGSEPLLLVSSKCWYHSHLQCSRNPKRRTQRTSQLRRPGYREMLLCCLAPSIANMSIAHGRYGLICYDLFSCFPIRTRHRKRRARRSPTQLRRPMFCGYGSAVSHSHATCQKTKTAEKSTSSSKIEKPEARNASLPPLIVCFPLRVVFFLKANYKFCHAPDTIIFKEEGKRTESRGQPDSRFFDFCRTVMPNALLCQAEPKKKVRKIGAEAKCCLPYRHVFQMQHYSRSRQSLTQISILRFVAYI